MADYHNWGSPYFMPIYTSQKPYLWQQTKISWPSSDVTSPLTAART
jgi:hypothetical protein